MDCLYLYLLLLLFFASFFSSEKKEGKETYTIRCKKGARIVLNISPAFLCFFLFFEKKEEKKCWRICRNEAGV